MAKDHLSHLARRCEPMKTHGSRVLKALKVGTLPPGVSHWPDDPVIRPETEALIGLRMQLNAIEVEERQRLGTAAMQDALPSDVSPGSEDGGVSVATADLFGSDFADSEERAPGPLDDANSGSD